MFPNAMVARNGIGDHTRGLASELVSRGYQIRILGAGAPEARVDGVRYLDVWPGDRKRDMTSLYRAIRDNPPDVVLVQFEQFSYGYRGYNPEFSYIFKGIREIDHTIARALYVHETYTTPGIPPSLGRTAMWAYQRSQVRRLVRGAHVVYHSSHRGVRQLGRINEASAVMPVFSNIPVMPATRDSRAALSLWHSGPVVLVFGNLAEPRRRLIGKAFSAVLAVRPDALLVYAGKDRGGASNLAGPQSIRTFIDADAATVSELMGVADMALAPFPDGVSGRRGSFTALLAHAVPTVTTSGRDTDDYLVTAAAMGAFELSTAREKDFIAAAVRLAADGEYRLWVQRQARRFGQTLPVPSALADAIDALAHRR